MRSLVRHPGLQVGVALLVLVGALAGSVAIWSHRVLGAEHSCPAGASLYDCSFHPHPVWAVPAALSLALLGLAGAAGVLVAARRYTRE